MSKFPVDLTEANVKKLIGGYPIQLKNEQLNGSKHYLIVHPTTHRRMTNAKTKGKGLRLTLTPPEVVASAEGFRDFWDKVKSVGRWVKTNVIDSPIYQSTVKPIVKELVSAATAAAAPMLGPLAGPAEAAVQKVGQVTGAYGLEGDLTLSQPVKKMRKVRVAKALPIGSAKPAAKALPIRSAKPASKRTSKKAVGGSFLIN